MIKYSILTILLVSSTPSTAQVMNNTFIDCSVKRTFTNPMGGQPIKYMNVSYMLDVKNENIFEYSPSKNSYQNLCVNDEKTMSRCIVYKGVVTLISNYHFYYELFKRSSFRYDYLNINMSSGSLLGRTSYVLAPTQDVGAADSEGGCRVGSDKRMLSKR